MAQALLNRLVVALAQAALLLSSWGVCAAWAAEQSPAQSRPFYVDTARGDDNASGELDKPFRTLRKALAVVDKRVQSGVRSDKIFLRGGVYKHEQPLAKGEPVYQLNLRGTADDPAVLSAMSAFCSAAATTISSRSPATRIMSASTR